MKIFSHSFLLSIFLVGIGFFSCAGYQEYRYEYLNRKEFTPIKKLYLLGVDITSVSSVSSERKGIPYYSSLFVKDDFLDKLIEGFNQNSHGVELDTIASEAYQSLYENFLAGGIALGKYKEAPLPEQMRGRWIKENHDAIITASGAAFEGEVGYLTVQFQTSVWDQDAIGFFKVYNTKGKVVWREEIRDFSPYIVSDALSPYLIKNKEMRVETGKDNYYQELKKIYQKLGSDLASELLETLN